MARLKCPRLVDCLGQELGKKDQAVEDPPDLAGVMAYGGSEVAVEIGAARLFGWYQAC